MKLSILALSTFFLSIFHADGLAEYHFYIDQNYILLKFEIEQNELFHYTLNTNCSHEIMPTLYAFQYIQKNLEFKVDGNTVDFELVNATVLNGHVILNLQSIFPVEEIRDIQVKNTCFYEFNPKFKNRVRIDINEFQKSYLLVKDKNQLTLE
jgi:hypothetical protein